MIILKLLNFININMAHRRAGSSNIADAGGPSTDSSLFSVSKLIIQGHNTGQLTSNYALICIYL
jgi:hypothetical protein